MGKNEDVSKLEQLRKKLPKTFICPKCKSKNVIPIIYGLPGRDLIEQARKGEIELGGCVVRIGSPIRKCKKCGHQW
jgi:hypothetical protein